MTRRFHAPEGCADFQRATAWSRRELLRVGGLGIAGLGLADLLHARARATDAPRSAAGFGKARSCILMFMWGGPSQLDTWDLKPDAPGEVRGEFRPIATSVPGISISEHFPLLATQANRYAIVRSMTHDDPAHLSSVHHVLTGRHALRVKSDADGPSRNDWPHIGSMLDTLRRRHHALPAFVSMPWLVSHPAAPGGMAPGQNAGWLGQAHDPFLVSGDPSRSDFRVVGLQESADLSLDRLRLRRDLLQQLHQADGLGGFQQQAFDMLTSPAAQRAFDLNKEAPATRDRYGRHIHGQCLLLARRLVEAGVPLVCVNWHQDGQNFWDTHGDNFRALKNRLMPPADRGFSALLADLEARGLLDETLLVWVGEFGRRPHITRSNAGREHWPACYSAVLAGGGIRGGQVHGRSDRVAAYPSENPVSPADLTATIYQALGVDPGKIIHDREGRPTRLTEGSQLVNLFA
jgi:hypothetical protein